MPFQPYIAPVFSAEPVGEIDNFFLSRQPLVRFKGSLNIIGMYKIEEGAIQQLIFFVAQCMFPLFIYL